jgi:adenylate cyclase
VRKAGNRIRVTAQLISIADGYHLWSERYDREMTDVFAIQDEISQAIADKLRIQLSGNQPLVKQYTENVEAYSLYLKARHHLYRYTPESLTKGKEYCEQAIALDPNYALAWYGVASSYETMGYLGYVQANEAIALSSRALLKVLELDETLPEAHAMMAVLRTREYDWKGAEREFRRALELGPESPEVRRNYNWYYLMCTGRLDESIAMLHKDLEQDPLSPMLQWHLGYRHSLKRQWERAIEQFHAALELDPNYMFAHVHLGATYIQMGKFNEGIRAIEQIEQIVGRIPLTLGALGIAYAATGRLAEARKILAELQGISRNAYVPPFSFAIIYVGLGEIDRVFEWLEKGVDEHDGNMLDLSISPTFDVVRSHARFHALLRKMNVA